MNNKLNETVATTVRYSDAELEEFRELIGTKVVQSRTELEQLKAELQDYSENNEEEKRWNMESTETVTKEYLSHQIARKFEYIKNLEKALTRITNKTYGICRETGELIPKDRLRLVPHATLSVEAKNRRARA